MRRPDVLLIWGLFLFFTHAATALDWVHTTIDPAPDSGVRSGIAVSSTGFPCIAYYDPAVQRPRYAYRDLQGWHTTIVGSDSQTGQFCSLAIGADDRPRIGYYDAFNTDLKFAFKEGVKWTTEAVDGTDIDTGLCTSLDLNSNDNPGIAYYNATDRSLHFAIKEATVWTTELVDGPGTTVGVCTSTAFNANGNLGISYYDADRRQLKFAYRDTGGHWNVETVDPAKQVGRFNSLGFDGKGHPVIAYYDEVNKSLKLATKPSHAWTFETVDGANGTDLGRNVDLVVDRDGRPQLCYLDLTNRKLKFARKDSSGWHKETVQDCGLQDDAMSLTLDRSGRPHISFCGPGTNSLEYVTVLDKEPWAEPESVTTDEDVAIDILVLSNDTDPDGDPLSIAGITQGEHGTVIVNPNGSVKYTPAADFNGTDTFSYTITDGILTDTNLVLVTVKAVNDPPKVFVTGPGGAGWFAPGSDIAFTVDAGDVDGNVQKVEFYNGNTLLGTATASPFQFTWTAAPAGNYAVTAKAYDDGGASKVSDAVEIMVGDQPGGPAGNGQVSNPPTGGCAAPASVLLVMLIACLPLLRSESIYS